MRVFIFWRWGVGVGWGGVITFFATSTTGYVFLHFHTYVMLRCWMFSCTFTHTSCYAAGRSLAKKGTFPRSSRDTKIQFCCGKALDFPMVRRRFHGILTTNLLKKNKNVQMTTVLDNSTIILWLSEVITDTASYRRWNLVFEWSRTAATRSRGIVGWDKGEGLKLIRTPNWITQSLDMAKTLDPPKLQ